MACLIAGLPAGSATARAVHGGWTLTDHLLARLDDRLAVMSWQLAGNPKAPYPQPMARPGMVDRTARHGRTSRPAREVAAYLVRFAPPKTRGEVVSDG